MFAQQNSPPIQETAAPRRLWLAGPDGARPRLLFAEDSDPVRIITAAMLRAMGCDVEAVVHGEEALRSASDRAFDVIVLDIEMPVMDGITAARSIRNLGGTSATTPIMALSAFLADAMAMAGFDKTFDIALPKPANRNELHAAVSSALACGRDRLAAAV
jgi:CheY-like chemotaxis protein